MKILGKILIFLSYLYSIISLIGISMTWYLRSIEIKGFSWKNWQVDIFQDFIHFLPALILYFLGTFLKKNSN